MLARRAERAESRIYPKIEGAATVQDAFGQIRKVSMMPLPLMSMGGRAS
jgi:hypothetical protein